MTFDHGPRRTPAEWTRGHGRYVLCPQCQRNPPSWRYPEEYKQWRSVFETQLRTAMAADDEPVKQGRLVDFLLPYDRMPGRFSRMALGMLLSAQDVPDVAVSFAQLGEAVGAGLPDDAHSPDGCDILPCRLLLAVCDEDWGFTKRPLIAPGGGVLLAFVDAPFAFYLHVGPHPLGEDAAVDITRWLTWGHSERFDGPRRREREFKAPFRFNAYDYGEFQYMLRLGALHAVSTGAVRPELDSSLQVFADLGLITRVDGCWELTHAGVDELANAPILEDRWQRSTGPP